MRYNMSVADTVIIGEGTKIWHPETSNLYGEGSIGERCNVGTFVEIRDPDIGDRCKIQAFVFIPEGVHIGDDVFIGPHVCFTNDKYPSAEDFGGFMETVVEDGANIGANSTIVCGVTIGKGATIGAGSVVTKDIPPGITVVGNPARRLK
jgi:acetyltransferase-like isoleucine patch superfamily enzyme